MTDDAVAGKASQQDSSVDFHSRRLSAETRCTVSGLQKVMTLRAWHEKFRNTQWTGTYGLPRLAC